MRQGRDSRTRKKQRQREGCRHLMGIKFFIFVSSYSETSGIGLNKVKEIIISINSLSIFYYNERVFINIDILLFFIKKDEFRRYYLIRSNKRYYKITKLKFSTIFKTSRRERKKN